MRMRRDASPHQGGGSRRIEYAQPRGARPTGARRLRLRLRLLYGAHAPNGNTWHAVQDARVPTANVPCIESELGRGPRKPVRTLQRKASPWPHALGMASYLVPSRPWRQGQPAYLRNLLLRCVGTCAGGGARTRRRVPRPLATEGISTLLDGLAWPGLIPPILAGSRLSVLFVLPAPRFSPSPPSPSPLSALLPVQTREWRLYLAIWAPW